MARMGAVKMRSRETMTSERESRTHARTPTQAHELADEGEEGDGNRTVSESEVDVLSAVDQVRSCVNSVGENREKAY